MAWIYGGSGSVQANGYALAEAAPTLGASFEVDQAGLLRLLSPPSATTAVADAKTNPPGSYTVENAGNLTASDMDTTTADGWNFVLGTAVSTWNAAGTHTAPGESRPISGSADVAEWIYRLRNNSGDPSVGATHCYFMAYDPADLNSFMLGGLAINPGDDILAILWDGTTARTVALGTGARDDGTWFRLRRVYNKWTLDYNVTDQATPPTSWTSVGAPITSGPAQGTQVQVGPSFHNASTSAFSADLLYCDYRASDDAQSVGMYARGGYDTASPTQRFVAATLAGTSVTISDSDLQEALRAIENTAVGDDATLTYSFVRGTASDPPTEGTYQAAADVEIGGSGGLLYGWVKMLATATQAGSIAPTAFRLPVS
jgi:hypothetical protein